MGSACTVPVNSQGLITTVATQKAQKVYISLLWNVIFSRNRDGTYLIHGIEETPVKIMSIKILSLKVSGHCQDH